MLRAENPIPNANPQTGGGDHSGWQDHIVIYADILAGKRIIEGARIAVEFVRDLLANGWTVERILHEYDHVTAADIRVCLAYAEQSAS